MIPHRTWLQANLALAGEGSLPAVLRRTVDSARALTHTRCGALAVVDEHGAISHLISNELDPQTAQGLLAVPQAGEDVPDLGPFLRVPLRVEDALFGHLYVVDPPSGQFGPCDEDALAALAATAGMAVQNAWLREQRQRGREWLEATLEVTSSLLDSMGAEPLDVVARALQRVARAEFSLVILPMDEATLMLETAVGDDTEDLPGYAFPRAGSITDSALSAGEVVLVSDARTRVNNDPLRRLAEQIDVGPMMFLPLEGQKECRGVIAAGRRSGNPCFDQTDVGPAVAFANHAALALDLADGRLYHQRVLLLEERQRIAAELHDLVLQRLFALGMSLQSIMADVEPLLVPRIETLITAADETIASIRGLIGSLNRPGA